MPGTKSSALRLVAMVTVCIVSGCSQPVTLDQPQGGALPAGTAEISIGGQDLGPFETVRCAPAEATNSIEIGDSAAGVTSTISKANGLAVELVAITGLAGFTGSYQPRLAGEATVSMISNTYVIVGSAVGFDTDVPNERTQVTFVVRVAC